MPIPDPSEVELPESPPVFELEAGRSLVRFFNPARGRWDEQRYYGPLAGMRFDHHPPPARLHASFSVWYAGASLRGALAESFGDSKLLDRRSERRVVVAQLVRPFRLLDLVGLAARRVGLDQEIGVGSDYESTRTWCRHLYDAYPSVHGLRWRGRQAGSINFVLDDRATMTRLKGRHWAIGDAAVWPRISRAARDASLTLVGGSEGA